MTTTAQAAQNGAGQTIRRFIVFVLLFILIVIAASGLSGLLARVIGAGVVVADGDTVGLATSLAFTLIAGPLAAVLWWFTWRGLASVVERDSALWGLYCAGMTTLALVLGTWFLLSAASNLVSGGWDPFAMSTGIVWIAVWMWHRWMGHHPSKAPTRLVAAARILGYAFGLLVGVVAGIELIAALVDLAVAPSAAATSVGADWWTLVAPTAVWALGGGLVWWLHWVRDGGARLRTGFAIVVTVLVAGLVAVGLTITGAATALYVGLRVAFEPSIPLSELVEPLGLALATAGVGAILWSFYRVQLRVSVSAARLGARLVGAGASLAAAASGVGIVVNSILAAIVLPVAESDSRSLLFAGLSVLFVGGVAWWVVWTPLAPVTADLARETGRKVYLIAVFGISALVAIITLLVIGFQIFEFALSGQVGGSLLDRVRAAVGLLSATALVGVYHFSVWRRDRSLVPARTESPQTIGRVVLVTAPGGDSSAGVIREATGAAVTVWTRTDDATVAAPSELVAALDGVSGSRVLVVTGATGVQVIPLES